jgi:Fic/DOC family
VGRGRPARATLYARLDVAIAELRDRFGGLPSPKESDGIWSQIWHLEAYHSTAPAGNTLAPREVEALLEKGRVVGEKPLREYLEVKGYGEAARWVYDQAVDRGDWHDEKLITVQEVRHIHVLAMTPIWQITRHLDESDREGPGQFREHDVRPFDRGMTPPPWPLVGAQVRHWVDGLNRREVTLRSPDPGQPLPEQLAQAHNELQRVHPFIDLNGRTGRLVLNVILVRLGYPPVIVLKQQRAKDIRGIQEADDGDFGPLGELLAGAMCDTLNRFIFPKETTDGTPLPVTDRVWRARSCSAVPQGPRPGHGGSALCQRPRHSR